MIKTRVRNPRAKFNSVRPIKQRMWDYMRRNKTFKPEDMAILLEVKYHTLRSFLNPLELAGVILKKSKGKTILDSVFVLVIKDNVINAPLVSAKEVYCYTTKISCDIGARGLLKKALASGMSQGEIADKVGVSKTTLNLLVHNKYPNPAPIYKKIRECL
jgi:hypothetical protein